MPPQKPRKRAGKKERQKIASSNISELTKANKRKSPRERRSRKQIIAIGLDSAGLSKKKGKK